MKKRLILFLFWDVLFAGVCLYLTFTNIDLTPARLFVTYWPIYVFGLGVTFVFWLVALKAE